MNRKFKVIYLAFLLTFAISVALLHAQDGMGSGENSTEEPLPANASQAGGEMGASGVELTTGPASETGAAEVPAMPETTQDPAMAEDESFTEKKPVAAVQPAAVNVNEPVEPQVVSGTQDLGRGTPADATPIFGATEITSFSERGTSVTSKWKISPHFTASAVYDDNVFLRGRNKKSDFIFTLSPGIGLRIGSPGSQLHLLADYTLGVELFAGQSSRDSFNQNAVLDATWHFSKLTIGTHLGYLSVTGGSLDVGDRVRRDVLYAGITSEYLLDDKFSVELNADETWAGYRKLLDSNEIRAQLFLNYQLSEKLKLGIGGTYGKVDVQDGSDQNYEQALVHAIYKPTEKLALTANAGCEFRQFTGGVGDTATPVFSFGAVYRPFERTSISLDAHRRIYASAALVNQDYVATGFTATIRERLTQTFSVSLAGGYENTDYRRTSEGVSATRNDNYLFLRPAVDWAVRDWLSVGIFHEFSRNASHGEGARSFTRNRIGVIASIYF